MMKKSEKLTIFLTLENTIDEFNFLSNEKNMTKIKIDTISMNFTTQSIWLKTAINDILTNQNLIDWNNNQIKRFNDLKKRIIWRIFYSFLNQKKLTLNRVIERLRHRKITSSKDRVIERSCYRKIALSKDRVIERSTSFRVIERLSHHQYVMRRRNDKKDRKWWMLDVMKRKHFDL